MRLEWEKSLCSDCSKNGTCLKDCPYYSGEITQNLLNCKHCDIKSAPCIAACPMGAIYPVSDSVLAIDPKLCDGCGSCVKACPEKAINIKKGKAVKCDLCAAHNFIQKCISGCDYSAIRLVMEHHEQQEISKLIGWIAKPKFPEGILIKETEYGKIYKSQTGRFYILDELPEISVEEARLVSKVTDAYMNLMEYDKSHREISKLLDEFCKMSEIALDTEQKNYLKKLLVKNISGLGPFDFFIDDDSFEEIALIGLDKPIYVYHRTFGWLETNVYVVDLDFATHIINKMSRETGRRITLQKPRLNACLPNGSRLHAVSSPVSTSGISITIRKFKAQPFSPVDLVRMKTLSSEALAFLWLVLQGEVNVIVAGNTGSGKTTLLNALLCLIPSDERIVITEETPEINIPHKHQTKLSISEELGIDMQTLVEDTLRMRPDRVVVGEVRTVGEVKALMNTVLAGQGKGSFATYHAQSSKEALLRMKSAGVMDADLQSLDLIIIQKRWTAFDSETNERKELRRVMEISEICEGKSEPNIIFQYDYSKDELVRTNNKSCLMMNTAKKYNASSVRMNTLLREKRRFIDSLEPSDFEIIFRKISGYGGGNES
ncbi:MAG: Flp pilus assembly complex ATPase component TadA [Candidatus Diapherotrites archaeon]|nr:Flp pilus assembly complex ATPase component TadA [Candidatus Diapherotrites archaeon]